MAALAASQADAATFNVSSLNDSGAGTLRQALIDANANAGPDVITFQSGLTGTITLTSGQLEILDSVDIQGPGTAVISVSGNNSSRVFYIYSPSATEIAVEISGLTVTDGADSIGGGIVIFNEDVVLDDLVISNNTAFSGGGLWADGSDMDLTITNTQITGNGAIGGTGGGAYIGDTGGPLLIQDSVISGNNSDDCGAGIYFYDPDFDVTIDRTTISGNTTGCMGGGIYLYNMDAGVFSITNSTISGNVADGPGGGMVVFNPEPLVIRNTTFSGNSGYFGGAVILYEGGGATFDFVTIVNNTATMGSGGGIMHNAGDVTITNSIVADNTGGSDIETTGDGEFNVGFSFIESSDGTVNDLGGNLSGADPMLGPLANNGGPTQTHRPLQGSPVIDAADPATTVLTDQRGQPREYPVLPDMGSVEVVGGIIQFNPATVSVAENGASVTLTVVRDVGTDPATVTLTTADADATAGLDYTAVSTTVTFAAGDLSETVNVPILDDSLNEGNEQFTASLTNPSDGAALGANALATVTITDFEPGQLVLSGVPYTVAENAGFVTITVNRINGANGAVSVNYTTTAGSATAPGDYTTTSGTLNWADGDTASKAFNIPIQDDTLVEGNEQFTVSLSAPTGGATLGAPNSSTVTITDFEPGQLAFDNATYSVSENGSFVTITVNRTNGSNGEIAVNYTTANNTAAAGSDYTTTAGTLNWADGDTAPKSFNVPILDDTLVEGNEIFTVSLNTPTGGATLTSPSSATVTITDVEPGQLVLSSSTYLVNENGTFLQVTVNRVNGGNGAVSVNYSTANGSATAGSDYTTAAGTLNWADGDTAAKTFNIPILEDALVEGNETFTVSLDTPGGGATLGSPSSATVTIADFEAGQLVFSSPTYLVNENGTFIQITVNRINGSNGAVAVNYSTISGTATAGLDYTTTVGTLNWANGDTAPKTFNVPIFDDTTVEGNEAFTVALDTPTGGATLGSPFTAEVTIADFEAGQIAFSSATYVVNENGGFVQITVNRAAGSSGPASVNYGTSNGSATAGADYTTTAGILNWADGDTAPKTFNVPILDDALVEADETFNVTLSGASGATIGSPNPATVTILDVEPGQVGFSSATYSVDENGGIMTITVNRTNGSSGGASVNYTTSNGTATAGNDYTTASGQLNWADGDSAPKSFNVPILDDSLVEGNETFTVTLSGAFGVVLGTPNPATVTINDIESAGTAQFTVSSSGAAEGGTVVLTVTRTGGSSGPLTVNYSTANGSATAGEDFNAASGSITFPDGDISPQSISIPILDDAIPEGDETFTVALTGANLGSPNSVTITIAANDSHQSIPALDGFGKVILAIAAALAGLWVIARGRIWSVLLALALVAAVAQPAIAQAKPPKPKKTVTKEEKAGKIRGVLTSITNVEGTITLTFQSGQSITVPATKLRVVDDRGGGRRPKKTISTLAAGQRVIVRTTPQWVRVRITG